MKYVMCCNHDQRCPVVSINNTHDIVEITDDYSGRVVMNREQFKKMLRTNYGDDIK